LLLIGIQHRLHNRRAFRIATAEVGANFPLGNALLVGDSDLVPLPLRNHQEQGGQVVVFGSSVAVAVSVDLRCSHLFLSNCGLVEERSQLIEHFRDNHGVWQCSLCFLWSMQA
jgi:hypothetical protein